jgi:hypothetical protein
LGLFNAQVGVDQSIVCHANQMFVCVIRDINEGNFIAISVCKPEIDDIDQMALTMSANEEVIGFDVTVDVMLRIDVFNMGNLDVRLASTRHSPQALERVKVTNLTNWLANIRTALSVNLQLQVSKRSSRDGPRRFMAIAW